VTTAAFERFVTHNSLVPESSPLQMEAAAIPDEVAAAIEAAAAPFAANGASLAVRSSGVAEDLVGASYAGQYETVLDVKGTGTVLEAVRRCWTSAFSARVAAYRAARDVSARPEDAPEDNGSGPASGRAVAAAMAVLVQRQIQPDAAGVAFTANPVTGDQGETLVSAVRGLGERLVAGQAPADEWVVRHLENGQLKAICRVAPEQAMDEAQVLEVAALARRVEAHFGAPQDVEWALRDGELFLLQARTITALAAASETSTVVWETPHLGGWARNFRFGEWLGDPVTPLFETWLLPALEHAFWAALRRVADMPTPHPTYVVVHGWYFTSMNFWPRQTLGMLWRLVRHPRLMRVILQFVPALANWALAPWVREWRVAALPHYRAVVEEAEAQVDRLTPDELLPLVDRVGAAAGDYFVWIALVAGAGYKTEVPLAQFYRKHVFPKLGGSHQALLAGVADRSLPVAAHAVHSLDWWHPTLGDLGFAEHDGRGGETSDGQDGDAPVRSSLPSTGRPQAEAAVREVLANRPRLLRQFEQLLATARRYATLREEIVSRFTLGWPVLRRAVRRVGDEFVRAGMLATADDVFFLTQKEVAAALRSNTTGDLTGKVMQRRREWERRRAFVPPLRLGEIPFALKRGLDQLEAALAPHAAPSDAVLRGLPASPGRVSGPVRIIRGPAEFDRLRPGDVLVAPTTAPAWTPLFARAAAVITDTGSILAHTSLVAREYGIPAVAGTGDATIRLRDGQMVTVDGNTGVIERHA
jgi:rifampicin phosphotransferase